jgi:hypothetical protein
MDTFYQRAYGLLSSAEAREAFNMKAEPDKIKDAYGRNQAGMRMLLARRLVESGVRMVSLTFGGWDHHDNIAGAINGQMPPFDQAFAMLITDLEQRGLLASTLVVVSSEFGRTPKINATAGRDHWPKVFSVVLAGGGIKKGSVYGSRMRPHQTRTKPLTVEDFARRFTIAGIVTDRTHGAGDRRSKSSTAASAEGTPRLRRSNGNTAHHTTTPPCRLAARWRISLVCTALRCFAEPLPSPCRTASSAARSGGII